MKSQLVFKLLAFSSFLFWSASTLAQVDPASTLLVTGVKEQNSKPNLDSGRYTVRPSPTTPVTVAPTNAPTTEPDWKKRVQEKIQEVRGRQNETKAESQAAPVATGTPAAPAAMPATPSTLPAAEAQQENTIEEASDIVGSMREVFLGGDGEAISKYKTLLHPEDQRQSILRLSAAPGLMYIDANSHYWYRDFHSSGPSLSVATDIWLTPFMGLDVNYLTTLAAEIDADPSSARTALVDHRFTSALLQFRKFSNLSRKSPSFNFGVGYSEYQMIVPKGEAHRTRLKSSGVALSFSARIPKSNHNARVFGVDFLPKLSVDEERTGIQVKSGTGVTAYAVQFSFGHEHNLDRNHQIFWRLSHRFDKSIYDGSASVADPKTGSAPQGVSVTTGTSLFELGYSWSD